MRASNSQLEGQVETHRILRFEGGTLRSSEDPVVVEEPLEIILSWHNGEGWVRERFAVTMRTPGNDEELALGMLFTENIISGLGDVGEVSVEGDPPNTVHVRLRESVRFRSGPYQRSTVMYSSCGICGLKTIEILKVINPSKPKGDFKVSPDLVLSLPEALRENQSIFKLSGGLHASALFTPNGDLIALREDVGRHNAMDKLVGALLTAGKIPASNSILVLSGRAGFELVLKAITAGIPFIVAIGAPTTLSIKLAREYGVTLACFVRQGKFNVYSAPERIESLRSLTGSTLSSNPLKL